MHWLEMKNITTILIISLLIKISATLENKPKESPVAIKIGGVPIIIPDFEVVKAPKASSI